MTNTVLSSTFFLTVLLIVGLIFFLRASVKERIEQIQLISSLSEESLYTQLQQYFDQRAYKLVDVDKSKNLVKFQGNVRPSWFLAIFLSFLAACGFLCLGLVLSLISSSLNAFVLVLPLFAPLTGVFYWQKAGRVEQVLLKIEPNQEQPQQTLITVRGHRDELSEMQKFLPLQTT